MMDSKDSTFYLLALKIDFCGHFQTACKGFSAPLRANLGIIPLAHKVIILRRYTIVHGGNVMLLPFFTISHNVNVHTVSILGML